MEYVQVLTTTASEDEAAVIADALLGRRLAACVQVIGPVESRFWWEGRVDTAREWLCLVKTTADHYDGVEAAIRELHSYDVPEIMALPVSRGSRDYLAWLGETVHRKP
jgi:periplasmic divalent cation tolerance protein